MRMPICPPPYFIMRSHHGIILTYNNINIKYVKPQQIITTFKATTTTASTAATDSAQAYFAVVH